MNFEFEPIPLVQQKKKYANFTILEIGGPEEIVKWRQQQEAKEWAYRMRLTGRDIRIEEAEKTLGQKLQSPEIQQRPWEEKLAFAKSERERLYKQEQKVMEYPPWEPLPEPKKTILQKIAGFFKQLWRDANF